MWKFSELPYERVDVDRFIADGLKLIDSCRGHTKHSRDQRNNYPHSIYCPSYINGEEVGINLPVFQKDWRYSQTDRTSRVDYLLDSCRKKRGAHGSSQ